jgi:hypothetical protein
MTDNRLNAINPTTQVQCRRRRFHRQPIASPENLFDLFMEERRCVISIMSTVYTKRFANPKPRTGGLRSWHYVQ